MSLICHSSNSCWHFSLLEEFHYKLDFTQCVYKCFGWILQQRTERPPCIRRLLQWKRPLQKAWRISWYREVGLQLSFKISLNEAFQRRILELKVVISEPAWCSGFLRQYNGCRRCFISCVLHLCSSSIITVHLLNTSVFICPVYKHVQDYILILLVSLFSPQ